MRNVFKDALDAVNKASDNCPIILPYLIFNIFSHYLTTRRKINKCYLEKTIYGGIRRALTHLFRMSGQEMENTMMKMSQFMSGIQRTIVNYKITREESLNEGKRPMSFSMYENMCRFFNEGNDDEYLFSHAFWQWSVILWRGLKIVWICMWTMYNDKIIVYFSSLENQKNWLEMHQTDLSMFIQIKIHPISVMF